MTNYTELKRLAEKSKDSWVNGKWHTRPTLDIGVDEDDSAYIAAASPDVVLSMIAEIDRLRTQNQALRDALKKLQARLDPYDYPDEQKECRAALAQAEGGV